MLVDVRVPLVAVLVDAVLDGVAGGPDAGRRADVGVFGDTVVTIQVRKQDLGTPAREQGGVLRLVRLFGGLGGVTLCFGLKPVEAGADAVHCGWLGGLCFAWEFWLF